MLNFKKNLVYKLLLQLKYSLCWLLQESGVQVNREDASADVELSLQYHAASVACSAPLSS